MTESREERQREAKRRQRIAAAFGEAMPESTKVESPESWGERPPKGGPGDDEWLRGQVPPHHGD